MSGTTNIPGLTVDDAGNLALIPAFFGLSDTDDTVQVQATAAGANQYTVSWQQLVDGRWMYREATVGNAGVVPAATPDTNMAATTGTASTAQDLMTAFAEKMQRPYAVLKSTLRTRLTAAGAATAFYEAVSALSLADQQTWFDALYVRSDDAQALAVCTTAKVDPVIILARDPLGDAVFGVL